MATIKTGLIQVALKGDAEDTPDVIRERMIEAHLPFIGKAAAAGVQVLCFQEVFNQPYFCPSQDTKWYTAAEPIPDGPTTQLMREHARRHGMVIVVPIYEQAMTGVYYNTAAVIDADGTYLGKYRKSHIPQVAGFYEKFFFKPGNSGWPVFDTAYCKLGVYICYDRHFPEGWRALALNGAEYIVNPSATVAGLSQYLWKLEQPAAAVANGVFIGAVNPPRRGVAVGHRPVLRHVLRGRPAGPNPGRGQRGSRRAGDRGPRHGHGSRGPRSVAVLPRPAAGDVRGPDGDLSGGDPVPPPPPSMPDRAFRHP